MSTSRRTKPKSRKAAALAALKSGRSGGLDDFEVAEDDAVYDYVDEDEYRELVDQRRRREDFVVDDDGLGYQDDGEEFIGHEEKDAKLAVEEAEDGTCCVELKLNGFIQCCLLLYMLISLSI